MACAMDRGTSGSEVPIPVEDRLSTTPRRKKMKPVLTVVLTRLVNLFQTIDKLSNGRTSSKLGGDDVQQLRYTVSKLLQYVTGQEKIHRDIIMKNSSYIDQLLTTLECCADTAVQQNIVIILGELVGKTHTSKRVGTLVAHGATHALLTVLVEEAREQTPSMDLLVAIHQLLGKLGPKDRKFAVKARLSQALPITLNLVRNCINNAKPLQAFLHVLKLYTSNAVNASYLGKNGAVTHLFKILTVCGKRHLTLLKYTLDTLSLLVKSKSNSARAIGQGGVPVLLSMFFDWHRLDTKNRHLTLRKAVLHVLKHITNLKSGRKAFMDADGIRILYTACQESIDCRESESIVVLSSHIMRKCFPKNRLAVSNLRSAVTFPLPESAFHIIETGEGMDVSGRDVTHLPSHFRPNAGDDEYESSLDNDDDVSSDDDRSNNKTLDSEDDTDTELPSGSPFQRTWEDLSSYKTLFPELHEFDAILENNEMPLPQDSRPIIIPTGTAEQSRQRQTGLRTSQSASTIYVGARRGLPPRHSVPNLTENQASNSLREAMESLNLGTNSESEVSTARAASRARLKSMLSSEVSSDSSMENNQPPSAVNLKTGSSIFSLDITSKLSPSPSSATHRSKNRGLRGSTVPSHGLPSPSTSQIEHPMRASRTAKTDDWFRSDVSSHLPSGPDEPAESEDDDDRGYVSPEVYLEIAAQTVSVGRYNKVAYPDMYGHVPPPYREPLHDKKFGVQRAKVFEDIDRFINPDQIIDRVVYDLDLIVSNAGPTYTSHYSNLLNHDEMRVGKRDETCDHLKFNSQFESGNLRKAIQVRKYEYDLILNPDVNTNHHHQWFYFEVSHMEAGMPYRFNIVNCEKLNSQFNFAIDSLPCQRLTPTDLRMRISYVPRNDLSLLVEQQLIFILTGMRPVMFSVAEAMRGRPHWIRAGTEICYYKNHFIRSTRTTGGVRGKSYYTATFTINFKHDCDVIYLAYHYPYTYTMMQAHLYSLEQMYDSSQIYLKNQTLCKTISGNRVPLLTITNHPPSYDREGIDQIKNRQYIFLSSRVHPGESNASWVMKGTIQFLLSNDPIAQALREAYIFKVVPMLNPDGVINGTHRCSLVAEDLNRRWMRPCPKLHPTIYHTKGLLQYLTYLNKVPLVFCDYHGHSRRKNVFLYGCSPHQSWMTEDYDNPAVSGNKVDDNAYKTLPRTLQTIAPAFSLSNCSFMVEKSKESTARVVVWRQIGIIRSYTMESSYCGCDQGPYKNMHISTGELEEMGEKFCEALIKVKSRHYKGSTTQLSTTAQEPTNSRPRSADETDTQPDQQVIGGDYEDEDVDYEEDDDDDVEEQDDCDDETARDKLLLDGQAGAHRQRADEDRLTFHSSSSSSSGSGNSDQGELDEDNGFD